MISTQILQDTIDGIKEITNDELAVFDTEGKSLAVTGRELALPDANEIAVFAGNDKEKGKIKSFVLTKVSERGKTEYVVAVLDRENALVTARLAAFQIASLLAAYKERLDKDTFVKDLLLDNLLLVDIYNRAKKFHISVNSRRVVFILESLPDKEQATLENVKEMFDGNENDFVTAVDENNIIIVKELLQDDTYDTAQGYAAEILKKVGGNENACISYGTIIKEIKDVSRSFKEARMALDVGRIFAPEKNIIAYSSLGIGRLIYQLPIPLCKMFIKEIFANKSPDKFDEETLTTINKFFENNLNVSETSRQLYIHRNTLVYRLDKLQKSTGLDLRVFEDAITFKIALMVVRYMKYMETMDY